MNWRAYAKLRNAIRGAVAGAGLPAATPPWLTAILAGGLAMALTDVTASALGATDPSTWKRSDWLADALPHLAFGLQTALTFETIVAT
jgi:hypothetical protein